MPARIRGPGPREWSASRDKDGHREYTLTWRVEVTDRREGPATALQCPGLPLVGAAWAFGLDLDAYAWCRPEAEARPVVTGEPNQFFDVVQTFGTRPVDRTRCDSQQFEDPLTEPQKVSGSFTKRQVEASTDRFGRPILNSAYEQLRGAQVEFDRGYPSVTVEQNVAALQLGLCSSMLDKVNGGLLWGMPRRTIRLADFKWERKFRGTCYEYYTRSFTFEIDWETWDRDLMDEGSKALRGEWGRPPAEDAWVLKTIGGQPPNPLNPLHFDLVRDRQGNPMRVPLNGAGVPGGALIPGYYYCQRNARNLITGATIYRTAVADGGNGRYQVGDRVTMQSATAVVNDQYPRFVVKEVSGPTPVAGEPRYGTVTRVDVVTPGQWATSPTLPLTQKDTSGDGTGLKLTPTLAQARSGYTGVGVIRVEKYDDADFLLLNIPASLGPGG